MRKVVSTSRARPALPPLMRPSTGCAPMADEEPRPDWAKVATVSAGDTPPPADDRQDVRPLAAYGIILWLVAVTTAFLIQPYLHAAWSALLSSLPMR